MSKVSIVVPIKDERDNLEMLHQRVCEAMRDQLEWELIVVDDGGGATIRSHSCNTWRRQFSPESRAACGANFGQAAAMQAGIDASSGDVIATMDGDLQNDPSDIPMLGALANSTRARVMTSCSANGRSGAIRS